MVVVENIIYSKEFLSNTNEEDVSSHGPSEGYFQEIGKADLRCRNKIINRFAINDFVRLLEDGYCEKERYGFDGKFLYSFNFSGGPKTLEKNPEENVNYFSNVIIKKSGSEKIYPKSLCDLEEFLIEQGFNSK